MIQMTYTGLEDRWGIERTRGDVTPAASDMFSKICGQCNPNQLIYALDYNDGVFVLLQSFPREADVAHRDCCYVHGYVFSADEARKLLSDYRTLLGVDYFATSAKDELKPDEAVFCKAFDEEVTGENLALLIECVYEAIFTNQKLEIRSDEKDTVTFIKKIINSVYAHLPLVLRKFVTFSNCRDNIVRRITVTDNFSAANGIRFDYSTGSVSGLSGKYHILVSKLFTSQKNVYLDKLEREIRSCSENNLLKENYYIQIVRSILPREEAHLFISDEDYLNQFYAFVFNNEKKSQKDYALINAFLKEYVEEKRILADTVDGKLLEFYPDTDVCELKGSIVAYFLNKYTSDSQGLDLNSLNKLIESNFEVFRLISEKAIASNNTAFISWLAKLFITDTKRTGELKEILEVQEIGAVCRALVQGVIRSEDKRELFAQIIKSRVHNEVVTILLGTDNNEEILWDYISVAFGSADSYGFYNQLDAKIKMAVEAILCKEMSKHKADASVILGNMHCMLDQEQFRAIERLMVVNGNGETVKTFYENVLSDNALASAELEGRKARMKELEIDYSGFVFRAINNYIILSLGEFEKNPQQPVELIKKIKAFSEDFCDWENYRIKAITEQYWQAFSWKNFDFESQEIAVMHHKDIEKSVLASAISALAAYISGKADDVSSETVDICCDKLKNSNKTISRSSAAKILQRLRSLTDKPEQLKEDVYALICAPSGGRSKRKRAFNIPGFCALILITGLVSAFCVLNTHFWKRDIDLILGSSCASIALLCSRRTLCSQDKEYTINVCLATVVLVVVGFLFQIFTKLLK